MSDKYLFLTLYVLFFIWVSRGIFKVKHNDGTPEAMMIMLILFGWIPPLFVFCEIKCFMN